MLCKIYKSLLFVVVIAGGFCATDVLGITLDKLRTGVASVLPFMMDNEGKKWVILGRNTKGGENGNGGQEGTYNDFCYEDFLTSDVFNGKPGLSAAKSFCKLGMLKDTVGLSEHDISEYIDLNNKNTEVIVACGEKGYMKPVQRTYLLTYITNFSPHINQFVKNFYKVRASKGEPMESAKDRLAWVLWTDLEKAASEGDYVVLVQAGVIDPASGNRNQETIVLSPAFAGSMKLFFTETPAEGENERTAFYAYDDWRNDWTRNVNMRNILKVIASQTNAK